MACFFNAAGQPMVEIFLESFLGSGRAVSAMIDTGFSGFLSLPLEMAFAANLSLYGTIAVQLADGVAHQKLACIGVVALDGERRGGFVIVEPNSDLPLVGIDFLKKFQLMLVADPLDASISLLKSPSAEKDCRSD